MVLQISGSLSLTQSCKCLPLLLGEKDTGQELKVEKIALFVQYLSQVCLGLL